MHSAWPSATLKFQKSGIHLATPRSCHTSQRRATPQLFLCHDSSYKSWQPSNRTLAVARLQGFVKSSMHQAAGQQYTKHIVMPTTLHL